MELHAVGKKGIAFFRFQREEMATTAGRHRATARPPRTRSRLVDPLMERFVAGELDAVYVVYARFNSALSTPPTSQQVLPIPAPEDAEETGGAEVEYILEPSADAILAQILPLYVRNSRLPRAGGDRGGGAGRPAHRHEERDRQRRRHAADADPHVQPCAPGAITQEIAEIVGGAAALE